MPTYLVFCKETMVTVGMVMKYVLLQVRDVNRSTIQHTIHFHIVDILHDFHVFHLPVKEDRKAFYRVKIGSLRHSLCHYCLPLESLN